MKINQIDQHLFIHILGKRPKIDEELQTSTYMAYIDQLVIKRKLVSSSTTVYQRIAEKLGMGKQAVYLAVKRFVLKHNLINETSDEYETDEEYLPEEYFNVKIYKSPEDVSFDVNIGQMDIFHDKSGEILQHQDWSDTLNEVLWEFARLPCDWRFDRLRRIRNIWVMFIDRMRKSICVHANLMHVT